jgi:hypothetical protein
LASSSILSSAIIFIRPRALVASLSSISNHFLLMSISYTSLSFLMIISRALGREAWSLKKLQPS